MELVGECECCTIERKSYEGQRVTVSIYEEHFSSQVRLTPRLTTDNPNRHADPIDVRSIVPMHLLLPP